MSLSSASSSDRSLIITGLSTDTKPTTTAKATNKFLETDTGSVYSYSGSSWIPLVESGAIIAEPNQIAHERNIGTSNQYGVGVPECNATVVDVSVDSTDVSGSQPALLFGIYVDQSVVVETVGIHDGTGGTELITIPVGVAFEYGFTGSFLPLPGIKFNTALFVESQNALGRLTVCWRLQ